MDVIGTENLFEKINVFNSGMFEIIIVKGFITLNFSAVKITFYCNVLNNYFYSQKQFKKIFGKSEVLAKDAFFWMVF